MPFKVTYKIFDSQHTAPCFTTDDQRLAQVEYNDRISKGGGFYRLTEEVTSVDMNKSEEYLYLVYEVRKLQKQYFSKDKEHRDKEVFQKKQFKEKELDAWNRRTQLYVNHRPGYKPIDVEAYAFYQLVFRWRIHWKDYLLAKKESNADPAVIRERSKQCRDFEKQIDEYIKKYIGKHHA